MDVFYWHVYLRYILFTTCIQPLEAPLWFYVACNKQISELNVLQTVFKNSLSSSLYKVISGWDPLGLCVMLKELVLVFNKLPLWCVARSLKCCVINFIRPICLAHYAWPECYWVNTTLTCWRACALMRKQGLVYFPQAPILLIRVS